MSTMTRTLAVLGLASLALTGCSSQGDEGEPQATPTTIYPPAANQACTVGIDAGDSEDGEHPGEARIECGGEVRTVEGDFRQQVTNHYDPSQAGGVQTVIVVGDERRVWMELDDETCLIAWKDGDDPTSCKPSTTSDNGAQNAPARPGTADESAEPTDQDA